VPRLKQQAVGDLVRRLREQRGLSLRALAAATDFSASFLSQLENGQVSPSIGSMERIATTLGVTLGDFFSSLGSSEGGVVIRAANRVLLESQWSSATLEALSPMTTSRLIEPFLITIEPGGRTGKHPSGQARGEFAFVVEGDVELALGPETYRLGEGDAATVLRGELRRWTNTGQGRARILVISIP
jgi:XRE family transcriptional regulator, regulator of sulfur utilization